MCTTCVVVKPSSCLTKTTSPAQRRKRERDEEAMSSRPTKRVTFSESDFVLGTAQDYDRTSLEAESLPARRTAGIVSPTATADVRETSEGKANFCGMWRRSHGFNWAGLLKFSGVEEAAIPEQAAKMQTSTVVHLIDHDDASFRLVVHNDSGHTQDQHFFIGGQPRPTNSATSANTSTLANMRWGRNDKALILTSVDAASGDEMTVSRHLASQGMVMVQHYRARRARTGETAEAVTIFRRMVRGSPTAAAPS